MNNVAIAGVNRILAYAHREQELNNIYDEIDKLDSLGENQATFTYRISEYITIEMLELIEAALKRNKALSSVIIKELVKDDKHIASLLVKWKRNKAWKNL
jgi:hypothetical protein